LCPESTLKEAGITPATPPATTDEKAAADAPAKPPAEVPFVVDRLSLGEASGEKINGLTNIFPPSLEYVFGFRIAGLISHQFFRPYAVTFDFSGMRLFLAKR